MAIIARGEKSQVTCWKSFIGFTGSENCPSAVSRVSDHDVHWKYETGQHIKVFALMTQQDPVKSSLAPSK